VIVSDAFAKPIQQYFPPRSPLAETGGLRGGKYGKTPTRCKLTSQR